MSSNDRLQDPQNSASFQRTIRRSRRRQSAKINPHDRGIRLDVFDCSRALPDPPPRWQECCVLCVRLRKFRVLQKSQYHAEIYNTQIIVAQIVQIIVRFAPRTTFASKLISYFQGISLDLIIIRVEQGRTIETQYTLATFPDSPRTTRWLNLRLSPLVSNEQQTSAIDTYGDSHIPTSGTLRQ